MEKVDAGAPTALCKRWAYGETEEHDVLHCHTTGYHLARPRRDATVHPNKVNDMRKFQVSGATGVVPLTDGTR